MVTPFARVCLLLATLLFPVLTRADTAAFDLPGPKVEVRVSRDSRELPIAEVPNLREGDQLWVHAAFPETQSTHYLLIVSFLRGSTNPPPENWFTKVETWNKRPREGGTMVTVPQGAEQVLLFLAPETGGDFSTLRTAVRGKPGAFVRASQDLNEAGLDRSRLEAYLAAVKQTSETDPDKLKERSKLLARSLNIKLDDDCFKKPPEQQESCLTKNSDQLVLDDAHSQTMVAQLTSGTSVELIGQVSSTSVAGGGVYSAYVGAVVDVVHLMSTLHTAQYQYIPALAVSREDQLDLKLNTPPSFRNPKSVLVIALPAVQPPKFPPLRPVDPNGVYCLTNPSLVVPVEGAPLVFSTLLAHDLVLHVSGKSGEALDLPVKADAARGGVVIDTSSVKHDKLDPEAGGSLRAQWGFDSFDGPTFQLRTAHTATWTVASADKNALVVGGDDSFHLEDGPAACVEDVTVEDAKGKKLQTKWKDDSGKLQINLSLKDAAPGPLTMQVKQFGMPKADDISLQAYSEAAKLKDLVIKAGDQQAVLKGTRLDEVSGVEVNGVHYATGELKHAGEGDELSLSASGSAPPAMVQGEKLAAHITLKDGHVLDLPVTMQPPRPKVALISKVIKPNSNPNPPAIQLEGQDELPQDATLSFSLKTQSPATFSPGEKIEVATQDESAQVQLSTADGSLTLQDSQTVVAVLDPLKGLGSSAFGPLRFRPLSANGEKGDWQPLVNLVRLPEVKEIHCSDNPDGPCTLTGSKLYLLDSVAADGQFQQSTTVPQGFAASELSVPHPSNGVLYVKLRDDPSAVNKLLLPQATTQSP
jgi:hypothetical protein